MAAARASGACIPGCKSNMCNQHSQKPSSSLPIWQGWTGDELFYRSRCQKISIYSSLKHVLFGRHSMRGGKCMIYQWALRMQKQWVKADCPGAAMPSYLVQQDRRYEKAQPVVRAGIGIGSLLVCRCFCSLMPATRWSRLSHACVAVVYDLCAHSGDETLPSCDHSRGL
jgi:hypothetical protein